MLPDVSGVGKQQDRVSIYLGFAEKHSGAYCSSTMSMANMLKAGLSAAENAGRVQLRRRPNCWQLGSSRYVQQAAAAAGGGRGGTLAKSSAHFDLVIVGMYGKWLSHICYLSVRQTGTISSLYTCWPVGLTSILSRSAYLQKLEFSVLFSAQNKTLLGVSRTRKLNGSHLKCNITVK